MAIGLCVLATALGWSSLGEHALIPALALGHFFLFCNVFRVRRSYELVWAGCFLVNAGAWITLSGFDVWGILAVQTPGARHSRTRRNSSSRSAGGK